MKRDRIRGRAMLAMFALALGLLVSSAPVVNAGPPADSTKEAAAIGQTSVNAAAAVIFESHAIASVGANSRDVLNSLHRYPGLVAVTPVICTVNNPDAGDTTNVAVNDPQTMNMLGGGPLFGTAASRQNE